jgi:transcriptional regulator with XRE-family HTH domain
MQSTQKSTIICVGGALAVASVGYGLGAQADDGTAVAGSDQTSIEESRNGGPPAFMASGQPPGFQSLAEKLGVDADKLAQAFRDFHSSKEGHRRDDFAVPLAKALGIPADRVTSALDKLHKKHEARFAARLADALDVSADKVQAALDKLMNGTPRPPHEFDQALADELGVDASHVRRALFETRPDRGDRERHHAMPLGDLASALGVDRADLRKALRDMRAGAEKGREKHNQALAKFLADRFDLSVDDVTKALDALPRPVRPDHGGRPGPGFGGPGNASRPRPGLTPQPSRGSDPLEGLRILRASPTRA